MGAGPELSAFSPLAGSPLAWFDTSDTASISQVANAVSQINDKSGNARHLTQATGANQPVTNTRTINSLNVLDFNGTTHLLSSPSFVQAQPITAFVVCQLDVAAAVIREALGSAAPSGDSPALYQKSDTTFAYYAGAEVSMATASDTNPHVLAAVFSGASSVGYLDGVQKATSSPGTAGFSTGFAMGASSAPSAFWDGRIGELLIYPSAFDAGTIASASAYLRTKWGTP